MAEESVGKPKILPSRTSVAVFRLRPEGLLGVVLTAISIGDIRSLGTQAGLASFGDRPSGG